MILKFAERQHLSNTGSAAPRTVRNFHSLRSDFAPITIIETETEFITEILMEITWMTV